MRSKQTNIRDVAKHAGISIATVSRILNGEGSFSPETVKTVERSVKELGYRRSGGSVVRGRVDSPTIALVVSDVDLLDPYYWEIVRGLYDTTEIHACGVNLRVFRDIADTGAGLWEELRKGGADGAIFVPGLATDPASLGPARRAFPVVLLDRVLPGWEQGVVTTDNAEGAGQAARYLAKLGHREIAYLGAPPSLPNEAEKREGFRRALGEEGLALAPENLLEGGFERESARAALRARLAGPRGFTALFASTDLIAFGAKEALDQAGLAVPRDLSLVGFGNIPFAAGLGLTTVGVPTYDMGRTALLQLLDLIQGRVEEPRRSRLPSGLVIRASCERIS